MTSRASFFVRLYPKLWRRRYGAELHDLLREKPLSFRDSVDLIWNAFRTHLVDRRTLGILVSVLLVTLAITSVQARAHTDYISETTIEMFGKHGNLPILRGGRPGEALLSDATSKAIVEKYSLYSTEGPGLSLQQRADLLRNHVTLALQPTSGGGQEVGLRFAYKDPGISVETNKILTAGVLDSVLQLEMKKASSALHGTVWRVDRDPQIVSKVQPWGKFFLRDFGVLGFFLIAFAWLGSPREPSCPSI